MNFQKRLDNTSINVLIYKLDSETLCHVTNIVPEFSVFSPVIDGAFCI